MRIFEMLKKAKKDKKLLEAEVLLAYLLDRNREWVIAHDEELTVDQVKRFHEFWVRLMDGEPLAYLVHKKEFYGIEFYVDERVLVPRPETELLVAKVIEIVGKTDLRSIVDVGTGSGAIAVALAENLFGVEVFATEFDEGAYEVAKKNCKGVMLAFGDLLEPFSDKKFDIIVANLPYIGIEKHNLIDENVAKYEPDEALYGGNDGLLQYKRLFEQIRKYEMTPKYILCEIGFSQGADMIDLAETFFPDSKMEIAKDLSGLDRNLIITLV